MASKSLENPLALVGEEKARVRSARSGPPPDGNFLRRVGSCLDLYEDLAPLRFSRLTTELGSEPAARERLRFEHARSASDQERALLRIQARLYGQAP